MNYGKRPNMIRPNMGRPDAEAAIPQVRQAKILDYVKQLEIQNKLLRQGLLPNGMGNALETNLQSALPPEVRPGNVGNLANVIWPYWFTTYANTDTPDAQLILPGQSINLSFVVTQEAAFVMTQIAKVIHVDNDGTAEYLDPDNFDVSVSNANDLNVLMRDASSTREFADTPFPADAIGDPGNPTMLPTPMWVRENGRIEFFVSNRPGSLNSYYAKFICFGYRIRTDAYEKILSGVTG